MAFIVLLRLFNSWLFFLVSKSISTYPICSIFIIATIASTPNNVSPAYEETERIKLCSLRVSEGLQLKKPVMGCPTYNSELTYVRKK